MENTNVQAKGCDLAYKSGMKSQFQTAENSIAGASESFLLKEEHTNNMPMMFGAEYFAKEFIASVSISCNNAANRKAAYAAVSGMSAVPQIVLLACNAGLNRFRVAVPSLGSDLMKWWTGNLGSYGYQLQLNKENQFQFDVEMISPGTKLAAINYPHFYSGRIAQKEWLQALCARCVKYGVRLFNDASLSFWCRDKVPVSLAEVSLDYPELSWLEAYSFSECIEPFSALGPAALIGSHDFIKDVNAIIKSIKDSFFSPIADAICKASIDKEWLEEILRKSNFFMFVELLEGAGFELPIKPEAGSSVLLNAPKAVFDIECDPVDKVNSFNKIMTDQTGMVGMSQGQFLRYVPKYLEAEKLPTLASILARAKPVY